MHSPTLLLVALAATSALAQTQTITLDAVSQISDGQPQAPTGPPVPAMTSISWPEMLTTPSSYMFMTTWTSVPAPTTSQPPVFTSQSSVASWSYSSSWNTTTTMMTMSTATTATMNIGISSGYTPSSTYTTIVPTTMAPSTTTAAAASASASSFTNGAALNRVASAAGCLVVLGSFFALL